VRAGAGARARARLGRLLGELLQPRLRRGLGLPQPALAVGGQLAEVARRVVVGAFRRRAQRRHLGGRGGGGGGGSTQTLLQARGGGLGRRPAGLEGGGALARGHGRRRALRLRGLRAAQAALQLAQSRFALAQPGASLLQRRLRRLQRGGAGGARRLGRRHLRRQRLARGLRRGQRHRGRIQAGLQLVGAQLQAAAVQEWEERVRRVKSAPAGKRACVRARARRANGEQQARAPVGLRRQPLLAGAPAGRLLRDAGLQRLQPRRARRQLPPQRGGGRLQLRRAPLGRRVALLLRSRATAVERESGGSRISAMQQQQQQSRSSRAGAARGMCAGGQLAAEAGSGAWARARAPLRTAARRAASASSLLARRRASSSAAARSRWSARELAVFGAGGGRGGGGVCRRWQKVRDVRRTSGRD